MKYYAEKDVNGFVIRLYTPHDDFDLVDVVEIAESAYAKAISSGEAVTDFQVVGTDLILVPEKQKKTIINEMHVKVKELTESKVLLVAPDFKRNALMAASVVLLNKARNGKVLTPEEEKFINDNLALEDRAQKVRDASNIIEAEITNSADPLNYNIKESVHWPE